jgi:endonuclease V-like protein UPF0215 family
MLKLKGQSRVLGIDDGPHHRGSFQSVVVMTVYRLDGYVDGFLSCLIETDGSDSSARIAETINNSSYLEQIRCIISDGACLGGFNILDMKDLSERTGIPVITVSDSEPDPASFRSALQKHFPDWEKRLALVERHVPYKFILQDGMVYVRIEGLTTREAEEVIARSMIHGRVPEPVRLSHMVASIADRFLREG